MSALPSPSPRLTCGLRKLLWGGNVACSPTLPSLLSLPLLVPLLLPGLGPSNRSPNPASLGFSQAFPAVASAGTGHQSYSWGSWGLPTTPWGEGLQCPPPAPAPRLLGGGVFWWQSAFLSSNDALHSVHLGHRQHTSWPHQCSLCHPLSLP